MGRLFVTGIGGLVGSAVAEELERRGLSAAALVRSEVALPDGVDAVYGDLTAPHTFRERLRGSDAVLHIAAATGTAPPETLRAVNVDGTAALVDAARAAGVRRFVFVSSIAAAFEDLDRYPYGASKRDAETRVRESGVPFVIARPTVVLGPGSPILERFRQLASLPLSPLPGPGTARIQPIDVRDLAACLLDMAAGNGAAGARPDAEGAAGAGGPSSTLGETIEVGGPDVVTLRAFLGEVRRASGRAPGPIVRLPLGPIRLGLTVAAGLTGGRFPVSPAQLAMFRQDGIAAPHPFMEARRDRLTPLAVSIARGLGA